MPNLNTNSRLQLDNRHGAVSAVLLLMFASMLLVLALAYFGLTIRPDSQRDVRSSSTVRVYCASGVVEPVAQVIAGYNRRFGTNVEIVRAGGSGELAGQIKTEFETALTGGADIFITADDFLLTNFRAEKIVTQRFSLAEQRAVIATATGSGLAFNNLRELVEANDIKFGIASEYAAVGKLIRRIAKREGLLTKLESNKSLDAENVMTLAQATVMGSLHAAVLWDTTVSQVNQANRSGDSPLLKLAAYADPTNEFRSTIAIGIVATTQSPKECLEFTKFLISRENGRPVFEKFGYSFLAGEARE